MDDFEAMALIVWAAGSLAIAIGMAVVFEIRERRSPVGRLVHRGHFG